MIRLRGVRIEHRSPSSSVLDSGEAVGGERIPQDLSGRAITLSIETLQIRPSEYVSIVGGNGSGKSTLLLLLAGLRSADFGEITFDPPHSSSSTAVVLQSPDDQIVGSTVRRDLAFGLECGGVPSKSIRSRVDAALQDFQLSEESNRPPHLLSEGEKQRLACAASWIVRPQLLLLDEPTSRLDPAARRDLLDRLATLRRTSSCTVVHVTHRSEEFMESDRILGLKAGRIAFDGAPADFLASPAADDFRPIWSPLHRFRRRLHAAGITLAPPPRDRWNDVTALLAELVTR